MTLKELRDKYPNIKARSKKSFLQKLKDAEGLGDTIEAITEATGIKKAVEWFTPEGKDCGCDERKTRLNQMFPYKATPECMVKEEYDWFTGFRQRYDEAIEKQSVITKNDIFKLHRLYMRIFRINLRICTNCPSAKRVIAEAVENLQKVYDSYK